ncbi:acetolactate synthase large subunit [soil metagenome]
MKTSDLFVKCLESEGVDTIFGIPGEENLDVLDSLSRSGTVRLVLTRHEQAAGFMAATYGRLTGKTGVCLSTLGPGATNFMTAAAYAQLGAMPMLMITGQKPVKRSKQGSFQIIDVVDMMAPVTKFSHQLVSGANVPSRVREAFRIAEEERPGATHLELPEDIAAEDAAGSAPLKASLVRRPIAERKALDRAAVRIANAKSPILVIGAGANRIRTSEMLARFVEETGIPFVTTQMGKGVVDESSDRFLGNAALSANDFVHRAIEAADLIVNIGHDVIEKPPFFMEQGGVTVIHVNYTSARVDPVYFPQIEVVGDIAASIYELKQRLTNVGQHWDFAFINKVRAEMDAHLLEGADDPRFPIYPQRMVADVRKAMPDDGIIALDNGVYKIWYARNYRARRPNTVLLDNALATMGAGLPSAMAAALVHPDRKVVAICGDGGFMMNSQELETAVRLGLDLVVLVLRDDAYGMIKWKQKEAGFRDFGLNYGNPDFVKYAEAYGAHGHRADSADGFLPLLQKCLGAKGVHLIELPIDYSDNDRVLFHDIKERAAAL